MPPPLNFKEIATSVDIAEVAAHAGITLKANRAQCSHCQTDDPRSLQIYPETNSFTCWASKVSGDAISLWAHLNGYVGQYRAAKELQEHFISRTSVRTTPVTPPEASSGGKPPPKQAAPFDPNAFAAKLVYTAEVEALGISEDDAATLGIGWHPQRKAVYFPMRHVDGQVSGFVAFKEGKVILPPRWLPPTTVVPFRKKA